MARSNLELPLRIMLWVFLGVVIVAFGVAFVFAAVLGGMQ